MGNDETTHDTAGTVGPDDTPSGSFLVALPRAFAVVSRIAYKTARATRQIRSLAYASEGGEAFRPVLSPAIIRALYAVSLGYVVSDVAVHTVHAEPGLRVKTFLDNSAFHLIASMVVPGVAVHQLVHGATRVVNSPAFKATPPMFKAWAPVAFGLGMIPFVVGPIDHGVEYVFDNAVRPKLYGEHWVPAHHAADEHPSAVEDTPAAPEKKKTD